jgi:hypothetical protein
VAVVPRTACSLGLSSAAFVVGEEPHPSPGERPDQIPVGKAGGLFAPRIQITAG